MEECPENVPVDCNLLLETTTILSLDSHAFQSFKDESTRATIELRCSGPKVTPARDGLGAMYGCIEGPSQTVKFFINEQAGKNKVENAKFIWNDWTKDVGDGLHADKALAKQWAPVIAQMYAPEQASEFVSVFFGKVNKRLENNMYVMEYDYHKGPAIDAHTFNIITKEKVAEQTAAIKAEASDFELCKEAIAKAVGYSASSLSGDGDPAKQAGYKSFLVEGKGKDLFFCEVHSGNRYKIKAALNGKYPFKYIAQGSLK